MLNEKVNEIIIDKSDNLEIDIDILKDEDFPFLYLKSKRA